MTTSVSLDLSVLAKYGPAVLQQPISIEEFVRLAETFPNINMERDKNGKVSLMTPVKKGSGKRESLVVFFIYRWFYEHQSGEVFSPSTGILLPDGAIKSPDCAWVSDDRLATLAEDADEHFLKVVPDFVVEVKSSTDRISILKKKMTEVWMRHGVRLAWLIDPYSETAWIYHENQEIEKVQSFKGKKLFGEEIMPGLELPLDDLIA